MGQTPPRYVKDGEWITYDDNDAYGLEIVPTHKAVEGHEFIIDNAPDQSEVEDVCDNHGDFRWGSCMFEDHMREADNTNGGYSTPVTFLDADGTRALGYTGNGAWRERRFFGR